MALAKEIQNSSGAPDAGFALESSALSGSIFHGSPTAYIHLDDSSDLGITGPAGRPFATVGR